MKRTALMTTTLLLTTLLSGTGTLAQGQSSLTLWHIQTQPGAKKIIQDAADRFKAANPGVSVDISPIANDTYKTKLKIAFGANDAPCIFSSWGGGPLYEYIRSDQVVDLTPYLQKNAAFKNRFVPAGFSSVNFNNKTYGIPAENTSVAVILYNKALFKQYNQSTPKTWDDLLKLVAFFKTKNVAAFSLANKAKWPGSMFYGYLVDRIGGPSVFSNAVTRQAGASFADPVFVKAGTMLQDLVKAGAFAQGYNGLDYDSGASRQLLYSGKAAMELMGTWELSTIASENPGFVKNLDFFPFPAVTGGKGNPNDILGTVGDNYYSISKSCKNPDAAFKLLTYLTDDKAMQGRVVDKRLPPVKGLKLTDPVLVKIAAFVAKAPSVQLWYDQDLAPQLGELHKDTSQALLGLSITPQAAADQMEALAKKLAK